MRRRTMLGVASALSLLALALILLVTWQRGDLPTEVDGVATGGEVAGDPAVADDPPGPAREAVSARPRTAM